MVPTEEEVDEAFSIAKTIKSPTVLHFMLPDVCNAYLKLLTVVGCKKAYEVAKYKEQKIADIRMLLNNIIGVCVRLETPESIFFAQEVFEAYPKVTSLSSHKNAFYAAQVRLGDTIPKKQEPKVIDVKDLNKRVEDILIAKGDSSAILGRQARSLVETRQFQQAIETANSIADDTSRKGALAEVFAKCCSFGDEEALGFAFEIAKNKKEYRDNYIFGLIETCKKFGKKTLALQYAEEIQNPVIKEKSIFKINLW